MIRNSLRQKGSAHLAVIALLALVLLGALGFIFWQNFINKESESKNEIVDVKKNEGQVTTSKPADTVLVEEYAIEFTKAEGLKNTTVIHEKRQIGEASFIAFTTQRVVDIGGDCSKGYPFGDLVTLSRSDKSNSDEYTIFTTKNINGYYYHIGTIESSGLTPESTCPKNELAKNDLNELVEALKTITPKN